MRMLALTGPTVKGCMVYALVAALAATNLIPQPTPASKVDTVKVSARINRAGEASRNGTLRHPVNRVRKIIERAPDGREQEIIVADFE
jgi:hypothetical protein